MNIEEIHSICLKYNIENYTINDDLSIDVAGDVYLSNRRLRELPLKFRNVSGDFYCTDNYLTSLKGAPREVGGCFFCSCNYLTSLEGAPRTVGGYFYCHTNDLESLKGISLNLNEKNLFLPYHYTYSDYLVYCRDLKFKKLLK